MEEHYNEKRCIKILLKNKNRILHDCALTLKRHKEFPVISIADTTVVASQNIFKSMNKDFEKDFYEVRDRTPENNKLLRSVKKDYKRINGEIKQLLKNKQIPIFIAHEMRVVSHEEFTIKAVKKTEIIQMNSFQFEHLDSLEKIQADIEKTRKRQRKTIIELI